MYVKNDMGLPIKKLLDEYFTKEQVQDALRDIGEPTSGNKDELIKRLRDNWESHRRDVYELLDFTDKDMLQMICYYYNLDATPAKFETLKRRIKKANLLDSRKRASSIVDDSDFRSKKSNVKSKEGFQPQEVHFHIGTITHSKNGKIGVGLAIVGIVVSIIIAFV